jgi:thiamine pyrophosphokinase
MQNTITIIVNGVINNPDFYKNILKNSNIIICADGGANHAQTFDIIPDYVIGDMDSITANLLRQLQNNTKTKVIIDKDQNKTDLELAITLAESLHPQGIIILGATGNDMDHTLANIMCLTKISPTINAYIIDNNNKIMLVEDTIDIKGRKDDIVSVIPITDVQGLTYQGLKWDMTDANINFGWLGVRNRMTSTKANITLTSGKILVIKSIC